MSSPDLEKTLAEIECRKKDIAQFMNRCSPSSFNVDRGSCFDCPYESMIHDKINYCLTRRELTFAMHIAEENQFQHIVAEIKEAMSNCYPIRVNDWDGGPRTLYFTDLEMRYLYSRVLPAVELVKKLEIQKKEIELMKVLEQIENYWSVIRR